jgi:hypothetical protein
MVGYELLANSHRDLNAAAAAEKLRGVSELPHRGGKRLERNLKKPLTPLPVPASIRYR